MHPIGLERLAGFTNKLIFKNSNSERVGLVVISSSFGEATPCPTISLSAPVKPAISCSEKEHIKSLNIQLVS